MNVQIDATLANGQLWQHKLQHCKDVVTVLFGDDVVPPVVTAAITLTGKSGRTVKVVIPNNDNEQAEITLDGEPL